MTRLPRRTRRLLVGRAEVRVHPAVGGRATRLQARFDECHGVVVTRRRQAGQCIEDVGIGADEDAGLPAVDPVVDGLGGWLAG